MKVLYKYRLPFKEESHIDMPQCSDIIRVAADNGDICVWAIVDTELSLVRRYFNLFKTGGEMPEDIHKYVYHGCGAIFVQMELMMYVFEKPGSEEFLSDLPEPPPPFNWKDHQEK